MWRASLRGEFFKREAPEWIRRLATEETLRCARQTRSSAQFGGGVSSTTGNGSSFPMACALMFIEQNFGPHIEQKAAVL